MHIAFRVSTLLVFVSALVFAETWTGKLIDASCASQQPEAACTPTTSTGSFALRVDEHTYRFDADGNKKAAEAFKKSESGAERAKNPSMPDTGVTATVTGSMANNQIRVESIEVQ